MRRRRPYIPEIEREYWRRVVFDDIYRREDVKTLIEVELKPLWRATGTELQAITDIEERLAVVRRIWAGEDRLPSQVRYGDAVDRLTAKKLRCLFQGSRAEWVAVYLDRAAKDQLPEGPFQPDLRESLPNDPDRNPWTTLGFYPNGEPLPTLEVTMIFQAGPYGTTIDVTAIDASQQFFAAPMLEEIVDETGTWDDWDAFADRVGATARHLVFAMQHEFKRRNPKSVNVAVDEERQRDAQALVGYLVDRQPLPADRAKGERLRRFARLVGLDFPVAASRSRRTKRQAKTIIIPVRR